MTDDDKSPDHLQKLSEWLWANNRRPSWEVLRGIAHGWPDVTAAEIQQAWDRMSDKAKSTLDSEIRKEARVVRRRAELKTIEGGKSNADGDEETDKGT